MLSSRENSSLIDVHDLLHVERSTIIKWHTDQLNVRIKYSENIGELHASLQKKMMVENVKTIHLDNYSPGPWGERYAIILPVDIALFTGLTALLLENISPASIPSIIIQLTGLKLLSVSHSQIMDLPDTFTKLTHLSSLSLAKNNLHTLPAWFSALTNLSQLSVAANNFETVPSGLRQLTKLTSIFLSSNKISFIDCSILIFSSIYSLDLSFNRIKFIPSSLVRVASSKFLHFVCETNPLEIYPEKIEYIRHVQVYIHGLFGYHVAPLRAVNTPLLQNHFSKKAIARAAYELKQAKRMYILLLLLCRISQRIFSEESNKFIPSLVISQIIYNILAAEQYDNEQKHDHQFEPVTVKFVTNYCTLFFAPNNFSFIKHSREYSVDRLIDDCYEAKCSP